MNKQKILELQKVIDGINLKYAQLPRGVISLHDFYEENGEEATMDFLRKVEDEATNITVPFLPSDDESINDTEDTFKEERTNFIHQETNYVDESTGEIFSETNLMDDINSQGLRVINTQRMRMETHLFNYDVLGYIDEDYSTLRITLLVEEISTGNKERSKIDLYERMAVHSLSLQLSELFGTTYETIDEHLKRLTNLLETHREQTTLNHLNNQQSTIAIPKMSTMEVKQAMEQLKSPDLLQHINDTLEQAGIIGEEASRMLLFIAATTYKTHTPLHVLIQGTSGSGKSHLLNTIADTMPEEDVISMTRVTSKSFYHYREDELVNKLMLIQDFDGLDEEAQYAFRELQTAKEISSSTTYKNSQGELISKIKKVKSQFASLLATTKADVYYDNMSRCIVIGVDESEAQTLRIIEHQNKQLSGVTSYHNQKSSQRQLKNIVRCIKPMEVINPYAHLIQLPLEAKMLRRLNYHYQHFIQQVTLLHQHQREKDNQNRLITTIEDIQQASELFFEAIMLKVDELDSSLRQFFNAMKAHILNTKHGTPNTEFLQRDIRQALGISKSACFRYMEDLLELEYLSRTGGYSNKGYRYKIAHWDDMQKVKAEIKEKLSKQIEQLRINTSSTNVTNKKNQTPNTKHDTPKTTNGTLVEHYKAHKHKKNGVATHHSKGTHIRGKAS